MSAYKPLEVRFQDLGTVVRHNQGATEFLNLREHFHAIAIEFKRIMESGGLDCVDLPDERIVICPVQETRRPELNLETSQFQSLAPSRSDPVRILHRPPYYNSMPSDIADLHKIFMQVQQDREFFKGLYRQACENAVQREQRDALREERSFDAARTFVDRASIQPILPHDSPVRVQHAVICLATDRVLNDRGWNVSVY